MAKKNGQKTETTDNSETEAMEIFGAANGAIPGYGTMSPDELLSELKGARILPQVVSLDEPGRYVKGKLVGPGQEVDYTDPTGEQRVLTTWRFEVAPNVEVDVLSAHQLDKSLPDFVGKRLLVSKAGVKSVKGARGARQVNQYIIAEV